MKKKIKDNRNNATASPLLQGLPPFIPASPRVLILGSMPSVQSLAQDFYYAHPQNRFFKLLSLFTGKELCDVKARKEALGSCNLALFDVIRSCRRCGSADANIHDVEINDINSILEQNVSIELVVTNGTLAKKLFLKHFNELNVKTLHLPSTSPANARFSLESLKGYYFEVFEFAVRGS